MRFLWSFATAALFVLTAWTSTVAAKERCCFKVTVEESGISGNKWGQLSSDQIGEDSVSWSWTERMILVYQESGGDSPQLSLARLGDRQVRPSSVYHRSMKSTVQIKNGINPGYSPVATPGACGEVMGKSRPARVPIDFVPRGQADAGPRSKFPNAGYFVAASSSLASDDVGCIYGHSLFSLDLEFADGLCNGSHNFVLSAPRRAYFRHGTERIHKTAVCSDGHLPQANVNHSTNSSATGEITIRWFPRKGLEDAAQSLKKVHKKLLE